MKVLLAAVFIAGLAASFAVASPSKKPGQGATSGTTATGSTSTTEDKKVTLCHKTGSKSHPWAKIRVSKNAVKQHMRHGDMALSGNGECPKAPAAGGGTTTGATTQQGHGNGKAKGKDKDHAKGKADDDEDDDEDGS